MMMMMGDIQDYRNCCVVFDEMLDTCQKLIDPFLLEEDIMIVMFIIYRNPISIYLNAAYEIIVMLQFYFTKH